MKNWYALNQNGEIVSLGQHETFEQADESTGCNMIWVVDEECARQWLSDLKTFLKPST